VTLKHCPTWLTSLADERVVEQSQNLERAAKLDWQQKIGSIRPFEKEFGWPLCMPEFRDWEHGDPSSLMIEYNSPWEHQARLADMFRDFVLAATSPLNKRGLIWFICPDKSSSIPKENFRSVLTRSLIGQLIAKYPACVTTMDEGGAWDDLFPAHNRESWKTLLLSAATPNTWICRLLANLMECLAESPVMILLNFHNAVYEALGLGSGFSQDLFASTLANIFQNDRHKTLIMGTPDPGAMDYDITINEETERIGSVSKYCIALSSY
jgi:hypothetical protein